ncbi:hypothetical protein CGRA01v4_13311 [Colletotrichum graminicola]|nr:hypothetical protein CGRA01v4_13311 [Colletotrichum graminicola]
MAMHGMVDWKYSLPGIDARLLPSTEGEVWNRALSRIPLHNPVGKFEARAPTGIFLYRRRDNRAVERITDSTLSCHRVRGEVKATGSPQSIAASSTC